MDRLCFCLLLAASVSDPFAPQDPAELPPSVETWYRVTRGSQPVGYLHERLVRTPHAWRYEYSLQGEIELETRGKMHAEELTAVALLDEAFRPMQFQSESRVNEVASATSVFSGRNGERLEFRPPTGDPVTWVRPAGERLHALPSLLFYALRQGDSLGKPGPVRERLIDPRGLERDGVEVVLEVKESVTREVLGKRVPVTPVSFLKPLPAGSRETELRETFVDRYGRIVEASTASGLRIALSRGESDALAGTGLLPRRGRRDPFDKQEAMRNAERERLRAEWGEPAVPPPHVTLDSIQSDLNRAVKLVREIAVRKSAGELDLARETYLKALVHLKAIRELAIRRRPELLPEIDRARNEAETHWDGAARVANEARQVWVRAHRHLELGEREALERARQQLAALRDRIEVEGRPERAEIATWTVEAEALAVRARTREELARARVEVSGITVGEKATPVTVDGRTWILGHPVGTVEQVRFVRPVLLAEINGEIYSVGDTLPGTRIRVERIFRHGIQVSLRDEVRDVGLRR